MAKERMENQQPPGSSGSPPGPTGPEGQLPPSQPEQLPVTQAPEAITQPVVQHTIEELLKLPFEERIKYVSTLPENQQVEAMKRLKLEIRGGADVESPEFADPKYRARQIANVLTRVNRMGEEGIASEWDVQISRRLSAELTDYGNSDKVFKEKAAIIKIKQELADFDKQEIERDPQRTQEEKDALKDYLDRLDTIGQRLTESENTLAIRQWTEALFTKEQWAKIERDRDQLSTAKDTLATEIRDITLPNFLEDRQEKQGDITSKVNELKKRIEEWEEKEQKELLGQPSEPEDWEKDLEEEEVSLDPNNRFATESFIESFINITAFIRSEEAKPVNERDMADLEQAKEAMGWYFQEAGRLGMLYDLDEDLDFEFREYLQSLSLQPPPPGERVREVSLTQVRDIISNNLPTRLERAESDPAWDDIRETGRFSQYEEQLFRGVRGEYVRRAYEQMRASLTNLVHLQDRLKLQGLLLKDEIVQEQYDRRLARIPRDIQTDRVYGEWNFGFETRARQRMERKALVEGSEPLFEETYFQIRLLGGSRRDIELGAEQAAEHIIRSAGTYSLDAVRQRRELLMKAIDEKTSALQAEIGSEQKAKDLIEHIQWMTLNKLDFYILQWLAQNLRMDEYSGYFEQTVMMKGIDRLKAIPTMGSGKVGLALWYLHKPEYRLFFRPGGFRNQLNESGPQDYLRDLLKEQLRDTLMLFELDDKGQGREGRMKTLDGLKDSLTTDEFIKKFKENRESNPKQRLDLARQNYQKVLAEVKGSEDPEALEKLREVRRALAFEQNRYQKAKEAAKNAVDEAIRVMDIFGESARLGAPSIITDNKEIEVNGRKIEVPGDHISIEDATLFYKFAIMQAAKAYVKQHDGAADNISLIRWRSRMWINRWKQAGLDRQKASRDFAAGGKDGNKLSVILKEGWEETGLTAEEWQAFQNAVTELRKNGYKAKLKELVKQKDGSYREEEVSFADIIQRPELQPVLNNFVADYKSSNNQFNDPYLRAQAAKGRLESVKNILTRLGLKKPITGNPQQVLNQYTQLIEDSRQLHAELTRLAYYEATHAGLEKVKQKRGDSIIYMASAFSADRIEYGFQGKPWGIGRAQHRKAFEYSNYRRTVPRAIDLVHAIPTSLDSLSAESASDDILSMFWGLNRLEKDDGWTLMTFAMRTRDAWYVGGALEGSLELDKPRGWGFLEKPLTDANSLWNLFQAAGLIDLKALIERLERGETALTKDFRESIVKYLFETTLSRFAPIILGVEKQLAFDRQALGSGAGYEENEKFALRFLEWILSEKQGSEEHGGREAGGWEGYEEIRDIIRIITSPSSYMAVFKKVNGKDVLDLEKSSSIWDEVFRKLTPGHNPRLPSKAPSPTYLALAA